MCRAGGRRCPGCNGATARAKHNARRRKNRKIKDAVLAWAAEPDNRRVVDDVEFRRLAGLSPGEVKKWARARGLRTTHLGISLDHDGADGTSSPVNPPQQAGGGWGGGFHVLGRPDPAVGQRLGGGAVSMGPGPAGAAAISLGPAPRPAGGAAAAPARRPKDTLEKALIRAFDAFANQQQQPNPPVPTAGSWATPALMQQVSVAMSRQGRTPVERLLLESDVEGSEAIAAGVNTTHRVDLGNGTFAYHKTFRDLDHSCASSYGHGSAQQPIHEVAAWRVAEKMGPPWSKMVAPCALRSVDGELGSISLERPGAVGVMPRGVAPEHARAAAFFDMLTGAQDRHAGNYLVDPGRGQVTLIDHGFSFRRDGDPVGNTYFSHLFRGQRLLDRERKALQEFVGSGDAWGLEGLLEPERVKAMRDRARGMLAGDTLADY